ncbi:MAG TPA: PEP/pyruvate-binding domain-containing protein, partial [Acidimicrobiales bacterium]|nr:PEP/pyruvate-binding domain-containing protein [Acidimicrobiales bacterium]
MAETHPRNYVRFFEEIGIGDVPLVGGKNASLGEMYRSLRSKGLRVPNGFTLTAEAYRISLERAGAWEDLHEALDGLDVSDLADLARRAKRAREVVYGAGLPPEVTAELLEGYAALRAEYGDDVRLAVRSSATAEDLPTASFAGQQETFLNVRGEANLVEACRRCFASLFTDRSIHYRVDQGFDQFKVALSIGVMKLVRSDLASAGVAFT